MPSNIFNIEAGVMALTEVNTAAVGYQADWQAPGGKTLEDVLLTDYTTGGAGVDFSCQVTSGALNASPNTSPKTTPATFCGPEIVTTQVGVTSFTLDTTILQDPHIKAGISRWLFEHDTEKAYFYLGLNGGAPPKAIGVVRAIAGAFGGDARTDLTATLSLPCESKPDIEFGNATASDIVQGDGTIVAVP